MKKQIQKSILLILALGIFAISLSSCNRGYGCPNEFSLEVQIPLPVDILK